MLMQDTKKLPSGHHRTTLSGYIFATKARIDNRKKDLLNSSVSPRCPHNMVNFRLLAWLRSVVEFEAPMQISTGFAFGSVTARHSGRGRQPNCGIEQRAPPIFGSAAITLGIGPHF